MGVDHHRSGLIEAALLVVKPVRECVTCISGRVDQIVTAASSVWR